MNHLPQTDDEWKAWLRQQGAEPFAFEVTRRAATERPFTGKYEDHWQNGRYHCVCCGSLLFDSDTKFDAGCGWPSFWQAAEPGAIVCRVAPRDVSSPVVSCDANWRDSSPGGMR